MRKFVNSLLVICAVTAVSCGSTDKGAKKGEATAEVVLPKVEVASVAAREVIQQVIFTGNVEAEVVNNIAPQQPRRITRLLVDVGDHVKKGQLVAELDNSALAQAKAQYENNKANFERSDELYKFGGESKANWQAMQTAYEVSKSTYENMLENTTLVSPISGVVTARNYDVGDMYAMSSPIYTVEQIKPVKLLVAVSESDYTKIKKGDSVVVVADALPELTFYGKIEKIYPTIDAATRTFNVEVVVANNYSSLRPGMFTRVTVDFGSNKNVVIPDVAVVKQQGSGERFVYVLNEDNTVTYKKVVLGRRMGAEYEVLEGISDGAKIVTGGMIRLKDGIKVIVNE